MKNIFERVVGIILLIPPVISVILFLIGLVGIDIDIDNITQPNFWSGNFAVGGGGYTSPIPIYLGLMAIGGAILLKSTGKNQ